MVAKNDRKTTNGAENAFPSETLRHSMGGQRCGRIRIRTTSRRFIFLQDEGSDLDLRRTSVVVERDVKYSHFFHSSTTQKYLMKIRSFFMPFRFARYCREVEKSQKVLALFATADMIKNEKEVYFAQRTHGRSSLLSQHRSSSAWQVLTKEKHIHFIVRRKR